METPSKLSEDLMSQSAEFGSLSDQLAEILKKKPERWLSLRSTVTSDTQAERAYSKTEDGVQEMVLRLKLRSLEKQMGAIKVRLRVLELEVKNLI